jgi:hypothetical protein
MGEVIFTSWPLDRLVNNTVSPVGPVACVEAVEKRKISSKNGIRNFSGVTGYSPALYGRSYTKYNI